VRGSTAAVEHAADVDGEDIAQELGRRLDNHHLRLHDRCVVDEHVYRPEVVLDDRYGVGNSGVITDVEGGSGDSRESFRGSPAEIGAGHGSSLSHESASDACAEPARRAGD
jgi:hypothetical protein